MKHLDLFSGIGGAAYALDTVYGKENVEHIFCEIDPFCQQVLTKHWPQSKIHGDIRHNPQLEKQHKDLMPELPYETSLEVAQAWHRIRFAQKVYESEEVAKEDLKLSKSKHRKERLKGLGNAWVPQVAIEIFKGIKAIDF